MASKCRQNYHEESEASINKQINIELNAHYQYLALVSCQKSLFLFGEVELTKLFSSRLPITIAMTWPSKASPTSLNILQRKNTSMLRNS